MKMLVLALLATGMSVAGEDPARFVDPFIGTAGTGHTFPGACVPFGMVQASPDSGTESWRYCSGYCYEDDSVFGFSQTHLNGTGGEDLGDVLLLPFCGDAEARGWKERIDKKTETASSGYYAVTFTDSGIRAEVTATEHAALYRFRYDGEGPARLLYDGQWGIVHEGWMADYMKSFSFVQDGDRGFSGQRQTKSWNLREIGFNVVFNRPCTSCTKLPRMKSGGKGGRYAFEFDLKPGETLLVKVGLAAGGAQERGALPERAKANLDAEIPGWDFDGVRDAARQKWNEILGRAVVEGTQEQKKNWYTSLYRLCVQPNNIADVGDRPFYSTFSCWDTFRAAGPLYTILCPEKAARFLDSMLEQGRITGFLPIWALWGEDNQCMIGTHSVPMIVDWFLKEGNSRAEHVDRVEYWKSAYAQIKDTLTKPHKGRHKERWDLLDKYGYYPFDEIRGESVSRTLECAYDDWCAGVMAEKLGYADDAAFFFKRSTNWKNVFDSSIGLVRGRDAAGKWREPFDPYALGHGADLDNDFTEGNAFQYSWHVMQDVQGLVDMMGGRESFAKKLDALFEAPPKTEGTGCVVDITGLIGQYVHGNEPSHHVIYFYPQIGHPEKAARRICEVFDKFYQPTPDGLCGNDDCGQMSAWYLFSAMGFYPFNPCGGEYVIGAPQVACAKLRVGSGEFRVVARNLSRENKYVKSVTLNGKPVTDWKIRHADIVRGGELVFEMEGADDAERHASKMMNVAEVSCAREVAGGVRVLFLGNSITLHAALPKIGWTNVWGMAASAAEKDYVHLVTRGIEKETGCKADVRVRNLAAFERNYRSWDIAKELAELADFDPAYLVIALGENVADLKTSEDRLAYRKAFKSLLDLFMGDGKKVPPNVVVRGVFWPNAVKDFEMAQVAGDYAVPFVRADLGTDVKMTARGLFWHEGVQAHPGDRGMQEIAGRILEAFFPATIGMDSKMKVRCE